MYTSVSYTRNESKKIIGAYSLREKKATGFALFKIIFLRNQSLSNARWFYGNKRKIVKGNLYLTENRLSRNELWCVADDQNYMCHMCKRIYRFEL